MVINIPLYVEFVLNRLEENGYEAFIVGGCVRDALLGEEPNDFDVTTNALPEEIEKVFRDKTTINVGKQFGTIVVHLNEGDVEVTTYRSEGDYVDGRRPEWIKFLSSIEKDLSRRDFTINAIAYNNRTGFIDPFNGIEDLKNKRLITVGNPVDRFSEDYLRIMRVVRFACKLNFGIEDKTYTAGKKLSKNISKVSVERIRQEFFKILLCEKPSIGIKLMEELELLEFILPELIPTIGFEQHNPHHDKDVYNHILCVVDYSPSILSVRLAALLHDIGKPLTFTLDDDGIGHFYGHDRLSVEIGEKVLKRFKCSNAFTEEVLILVKEHMNKYGNFSDKGVKRLIKRVGEKNIFNLFDLQKADRKCSSSEASIENILELEGRVKKALEENEAFDIKHLKIDGNDIINLGYSEGKIIGDILGFLLDIVIEDPSKNSKKVLEEIVLMEYPFLE
ncbi:MAG TPA: HD domain-containing protein [Tissierellales bacterium]|nr:HD domain-containing protein [Tissierellales bacterium]